MGSSSDSPPPPSEKPTSGITPVTSAFSRPRSARILGKAQFDAVFAANIRLHSDHFRVHLRADTGEPARLGLAIAKRAAKRAVDRNRIKRHVREAFRHARSNLAGFDFVVQAKDTALAADGKTLQREITELFEKARLRRFRAPAVPASVQT